MTANYFQEKVQLHDVVDLTVCSAIYKVCNGNQFEYMNGSDFVAFMNAKPLQRPVRIRLREKSRVCYLFYAIAKETMPTCLAKEWVFFMLQHCLIKKEFYRSHYKDAEAAGATEDNVRFVMAVKSAIQEAQGCRYHRE